MDRNAKWAHDVDTQLLSCRIIQFEVDRRKRKHARQLWETLQYNVEPTQQNTSIRVVIICIAIQQDNCFCYQNYHAWRHFIVSSHYRPTASKPCKRKKKVPLAFHWGEEAAVAGCALGKGARREAKLWFDRTTRHSSIINQSNNMYHAWVASPHTHSHQNATATAEHKCQGPETGRHSHAASASRVPGRQCHTAISHPLALLILSPAILGL